MSEVKLPEPFGWKMSNPEFDYGITVHERYQVEDYLTQGWKIEETTFRTVQMEEYAEQRVREALAEQRMHAYMDKTRDSFLSSMELTKDLDVRGVLCGPIEEKEKKS